jgi:anti-anti-sigma regulatory factor
MSRGGSLSRLRVEVSTDAGHACLRFAGEIDESSKFGDLAGQVTPPVVIDLGEVTFINSIGVRDWVRFLRTLTARGPVRLRRCSEAMVLQFNMVTEASALTEIESFQAPYVCAACGAEEPVELTVARHLPEGRGSRLPEFPCSECGGALRFGEVPERYLLFLER